MESRIWKVVLSVLPRSERDSSHRDYSVRIILQVFLWSVLHDRPVCWACDPENWPGRFRPRKLPHPSTMSRRLREPDIQTCKQRIHRKLMQRLELVVDPTRLAFIDGRPLPISRQSLDPDSANGRGAGGFYRGYKMHAITSPSQLILTFEVWPMNVSEKVIGCQLITACDAPCDRIIGDGVYDTVNMHEAALSTGRRLYAPVTNGRVGRRGDPNRLRSLRFFKTAIGRKLRRRRIGIEQTFARTSNLGFGLKQLPNWVRHLSRVRAWVWGKIVAYHAYLIAESRK